MSFKTSHTLKERIIESHRILTKYPERIPVIVEQCSNSPQNLPDLERSKFLVPDNITCGQFLYIIRNRIQLSPDKAMFLFINDLLPTPSSLMKEIYEEHKDEDKFLYCSYSSESTFG